MNKAKLAALLKWKRCTRCGLCKIREKVVLGRGVMPAEILFIGEAPGKSENMIGEAFVGPAGRMFNYAFEKAVELAGLKVAPTVYITNVIACYPSDVPYGKFRPPTHEEETACRQRLLLTQELVDPEHIVFLGNVARDSCSQFFPYATHLYHPSYLRRKGGDKSTEYRAFVRTLADLFKKSNRRSPLKSRDVFGRDIHG